MEDTTSELFISRNLPIYPILDPVKDLLLLRPRQLHCSWREANIGKWHFSRLRVIINCTNCGVSNFGVA